MTYLVVWTEPAVEDAARVLEFLYERDREDQAARFLDSLRRAIGSLDTMPQRGRVVPELRKEGITGYHELLELPPYTIIYTIADDTVYVHLIADRRRDLEELLLDRLLRR